MRQFKQLSQKLSGCSPKLTPMPLLYSVSNFSGQHTSPLLETKHLQEPKACGNPASAQDPVVEEKVL